MFEETHGIHPASLARYLNARAKTVAEEGEAVEVESPEGVTILTAHNSKGTEYPLVIVTGLETEGRKDTADPLLFFHDETSARLGLKVPEAAHFDGRLESSAPYDLLKHLRRDRNRAEEKRLDDHPVDMDRRAGIRRRRAGSGRRHRAWRPCRASGTRWTRSSRAR